MAFPAHSGHSQLAGGGFSPVIYSKKAQLAFRKTSTVQAITNTDYSGEIANKGDTVRIIKEPTITVSDYTRGAPLSSQDLTDTDFTMIVDQAKSYQFELDDIEEMHSHMNWISLASDNAGYRLRDSFDQDVLGYMSGYSWNGSAWAARTASAGTKADTNAGADELLAANKLTQGAFGGSTAANSIPLAAGGGTGVITSPLAVLNRMARLMDAANVDTDGRWFVCDPVFKELLLDEDAKLINSDFGGGDEMRNGKMPGKIRGFRIYASNNLPYKGTGAATAAAAGSATNFGVVVAGHDSAVAVADQLVKTESFRSPTTFADVVRGLQVYGRKILRPEAILTANYNLA